MTLAVRTPFGRPVAWADAGLTGGRGGGRLVVAGRRLARATPSPFDDFLLCVLAEGATARAGPLAVAAFVEAFLAGDEVDVLWRLRDAVTAAGARLMSWAAGALSATLTALFLAGDGTAYGVSVGDAPLLVIQHDNVGVQVLGHEPGMVLGTGVAGDGVVEQWWPDHLAGDGARTRLEPGTALVLAHRDTTAGITVRFDGGQASPSQLVAQMGWLVSTIGHYGARQAFGLACLSDDGARAIVPGFLRRALEVGVCARAGLERSFELAGGDAHRTRLAVVGAGPDGATATFASGEASVEHAQGHVFTLRVGSGTDPLDRGIAVAFQDGTGPGAVVAWEDDGVR